MSLSPTATVSAWNPQTGQGGQVYQGALSGVMPAAWGANNWGASNLASSMAGAVNSNGQLTMDPNTMSPDQLAYAQSQMEKWGANQQQQQYNTAASMLGFGGSGGAMNGGYSAPAAGMGTSFGGAQPGMGTKPNYTSTMTAAMGSGGQGPIQYPQGTIDNRTGQMINNSTGELMPRTSFGGMGNPGGAFGQPMMGTSGAGPGPTFGGGGSSSGSNAGGFAANQPLYNAFSSTMQNQMANPGLSQKVIEGMINKGTDEIAEGERAAGLDLTERAVASGAGEGGAIQGGMRSLHSDYAGQKAGLAQNVRLTAEKDRIDQLQKSTQTAGDYLGKVQDREAQDMRFQQQMARDDRNQFMSMMLANKPAVPQLTGGGQGFAFSPTGGGASNSGAMFSGGDTGGNAKQSMGAGGGFNFSLGGDAAKGTAFTKPVKGAAPGRVGMLS